MNDLNLPNQMVVGSLLTREGRKIKLFFSLKTSGLALTVSVTLSAEAASF